MKTSQSLFALTFAAIGFAAGWNAAQHAAALGNAGGRGEVSQLRDTVVRHDTVCIAVNQPVGRVRERVRYVYIPMAEVDTVKNDTLRLGAERVVYADSMYRAVVSGVDARLDSLTLFVPRVEIREMLVPSSPSRWSVGVTAGLGATASGFSPCITVGVSYRLWGF